MGFLKKVMMSAFTFRRKEKKNEVIDLGILVVNLCSHGKYNGVILLRV